ALPQRICASHLEKEPPHQHNLTKLIVRHPPTACTGPAQRQDRSASLRCARSRLIPALTQCCLHGGRKPAKPLLNNLLTHPAPSGMTVPHPASQAPAALTMSSSSSSQKQLGPVRSADHALAFDAVYGREWRRNANIEIPAG